jgi:hypothetical protein
MVSYFCFQAKVEPLLPSRNPKSSVLTGGFGMEIKDEHTAMINNESRPLSGTEGGIYVDYKNVTTDQIICKGQRYR